MNCMNLMASSARATQYASSSNAGDDEGGEGNPLFSNQTRLIGPPLIMEAASKVDRCLARLQSLQGAVTMHTPPVSTSVSVTGSPNFSRSRSCLHGSPKMVHDDKIRIHDVLRWSDDFSGKFKQERRDQYLKRLSRSKTEVFDDKKDPLDPHGEWKHWSSPAGDVHKVISEILMASQIAKQITSMVNAALVQTDVSSEDEDRAKTRSQGERDRIPTKESPSPAKLRAGEFVQKRKDDPLHKFRVVVPTDGLVKRRGNAGTRKEVLYPKSKQEPDLVRPADENQVLSSTAKKMQSRRSPRATAAAAAVEARAPDTWAAQEITNKKSPPRTKERKKESKKMVSTTSSITTTTTTITEAKRVRSSRSPPRTSLDEPTVDTMHMIIQPSHCSGPNLKPSSSSGARLRRSGTSAESRLVASTSIPGSAALPSKPIKKPRGVSGEAVALPSRTNRSSELNVVTGAVEELRFPSAAPAKLETCIPLAPVEPIPEEPALEGPNEISPCNPLFSSSLPESRESKSCMCSPQKLDQSDTPYPGRRQPLIGSLRHKFVMEATEIKDTSKPWRLNPAKSSKAVLFSNPAFAPASPAGSRPGDDNLSAVVGSPPKSPPRSTSATRRMMNRIGQAINSGRRSISPEITRRLESTRRKIISLSPSKSLPSLISRLPSRGKKSESARAELTTITSSSAPRGSLARDLPSSKPAPISGELPLPPVRKAQQLAAQQKVRVSGHASTGSVSHLKDRDAVVPPGAASTVRERNTAISAAANPATRVKVVTAPGAAPVAREKAIITPAAAPAARVKDVITPAARAARGKDGFNPRLAAPAASEEKPCSSSSVQRQLKDLDCNAHLRPTDGTRKTAPKETLREKGMISHLKSHSGSDWENEVGVIGVLSSCRRWVEESAPPLPGAAGLFEKENIPSVVSQRRRPLKENVIPSAAVWDDEVGVIGVLSSCRRKVDEKVVPTAVDCATTPGIIRRSWSTGARSFSTGKMRTGPSFLKKARDWIRTQTPLRDRSRTPSAGQLG